MEGENRNPPDNVGLEAALQRAPHKFGFFQVLRRIDCAVHGRARIGEGTRPADEPVRLAQEPSLTFAPRTVASYDAGGADRQPRLSVYFLGLFGPNGPLPLHLTEYARDRMRNFGDFAFARFADVFHHRMLSLFYRAWANVRPTVHLDRAEKDRFATYIGSLAGLGMPSLRRRDAMPDFAKYYFAGRLGAPTRNAEGLIAIIGSFFRIPASLEEFVGEWLDIPEQSQWRLGASSDTGTLGHTATIGGRVWNCQHKFRLVLGPVDYGSFSRLLPGGPDLPLIVSIVRNYVGDELDWDMNVVLRSDTVPDLVLDGSVRLGWSSWLCSDGPATDRDDLVLNPISHAA